MAKSVADNVRRRRQFCSPACNRSFPAEAVLRQHAFCTTSNINIFSSKLCEKKLQAITSRNILPITLQQRCATTSSVIKLRLQGGATAALLRRHSHKNNTIALQCADAN